MANTAQARKRARQNEAQRQHNASLRSEFRTAIKRVRAAIDSGDKAAAATAFQACVSTLDSIADKKVYHKNKAARHKSRLSAAIKAMTGSAPTAAAKPVKAATPNKAAAAKKPAAPKVAATEAPVADAAAEAPAKKPRASKKVDAAE